MSTKRHQPAPTDGARPEPSPPPPLPKTAEQRKADKEWDRVTRIMEKLGALAKQSSEIPADAIVG